MKEEDAGKSILSDRCPPAGHAERAERSRNPGCRMETWAKVAVTVGPLTRGLPGDGVGFHNIQFAALRGKTARGGGARPEPFFRWALVDLAIGRFQAKMKASPGVDNPPPLATRSPNRRRARGPFTAMLPRLKCHRQPTGIQRSSVAGSTRAATHSAGSRNDAQQAPNEPPLPPPHTPPAISNEAHEATMGTPGMPPPLAGSDQLTEGTLIEKQS